MGAAVEHMAKRVEALLRERDMRFSLRWFHEWTAGLDGPTRAAVFNALPPDRQREAWESLADLEATRRTLEDCDPLDLDRGPRKRKRRSVTDPVSLDPNAPDPLLTIPPPEYVERLTGVEVPTHGMMRCVLPGHDERTASLKVYEDPDKGWYCYGCHRGGSIFDLAAALWGLPTRGRAFRALRARLRRELGLDTLGGSP